MKRILLIGGAGFIGHTLALELKKDGFDVSIIDGLEVNNLVSLQDSRNSFANRKLYLNFIEERLSLLRSAEIPIYVEDARDYQRLSRIVNEIQPHAIFLLAAVAHASRANKDPYSTFDHSFRTLENTLDISRSLTNSPHVIFFSSSMVYGEFKGKSPNEEENCDPRNIYGALKFGGEKLALAYGNVFDLPITIVRPSALYGPRCVSRRVLQVFIENAIRGNNLIIRGDGNETLDFTYIDDLILGLKSIVLNKLAFGEVFNLTRGSAESLLTAAEFIQTNFPKIDIVFEERDALNPERGSLDISKARKMLQFTPQFNLTLGLSLYIEWYKQKSILFENHSNFSEVNE